jgi:hypothetical protein
MIESGENNRYRDKMNIISGKYRELENIPI